MSTEEPDDLEAKVRAIVNDELEKQGQNDGSVSMSRRGLLAGALGLGVGGAGLGSLGAQRVAAQDSTTGGYIGTESNPVETIHADSIHTEVLDELDIQGKDIGVASVSTGDAQFGGKPWADVTHPDFGAAGDGSTDDTAAIQEAFDNYERVYFPKGTYNVTSTLDASSVKYITGDGPRVSRVVWAGSSDGSNLIEVIPSSRVNRFGIYGFGVEDAPNDGVHLEDVHQWFVDWTWTEGHGRHGIYHDNSWKGGVFRTLSNNNGDTGIHGGSGAQATSVFNCHVLGNLTGIRPGGRSTVTGCTLEKNDTDLYVDRDGVTLIGNYHEPTSDSWDPSNPLYNVHVDNANEIVIESGHPASRKGVGIMIENSTVTLVQPSTDDPISSNGSDSAWTSPDNLAWVADSDSTVHLNGVPNAPFQVSDIRSIKPSRLSTIRSPSDEWSGDGDFSTDGDSDGLADGWSGRTADESFSLTSDSVYPGANRQQVTTTGDGDGILHSASLDANTTYTVGAFLEMNGTRVYFADGGGSRLAGFDWFEHEQGPRFCVATFTTSSSPASDYGFLSRSSGDFWVDGAKLVEGDYGINDFPFLE